MNHSRYEELAALLGPDQRGLIVIRPDPDSLASAWALALLFKLNHSAADIAISEPIKRIENRTMVKLLRIPVLAWKDVQPETYSRFCLVDGQPNQFPELSLNFSLVIDHHPLHPEYSYRFSDIRPEMGATSTILTEYLIAAKVRIREKLATALCYGIITDTDHFLRNMTKADAQAIAHLFPLVNYHRLQVIEQAEIPSRQLPYFDHAFHRLAVKNRRAVVHMGPADTADIAVIVADFLIRVSGIQFVALSCIVAEKLVIIFRSRDLRKNAGKIAARLFSELGSAGGHQAAARAEIPLDRLPGGLDPREPAAVEKYIARLLKKPGKAG